MQCCPKYRYVYENQSSSTFFTVIRYNGSVMLQYYGVTRLDGIRRWNVEVVFSKIPINRSYNIIRLTENTVGPYLCIIDIKSCVSYLKVVRFFYETIRLVASFGCRWSCIKPFCGLDYESRFGI